jgi:hypothetical protein
MRITSRLFRTVLVAAGLMAVSATAAQAMPLGPANITDRDPLGFTAAHHQLPVVSHSPGPTSCRVATLPSGVITRTARHPLLTRCSVSAGSSR